MAEDLAQPPGPDLALGISTAELPDGGKLVGHVEKEPVLLVFGPTSLTFIVTATQHLVSSHGTTNASTQYAITVTGSGTSWQVNDIELSTVGQS